jgi:hypothetical protein
VTDLLTEVDARLQAIVLGTLSTTGLSARAVQNAIPAGDFRFQPQRGWLRDPNAEGAYDRTVGFEYPAGNDDPNAPDSEWNGTGFRLVSFSLLVGYVYGPSNANRVHALRGEVASAVVLRPDMRARGDSERLRRALSLGDLFEASPVTNPTIESVRRIGPSQDTDLGNGRYFCTTPYLMRLELDHNQVYGP